MDEPVVEKEDVRTIQFLLADILDELQYQTELLEGDDGETEETD